MAEKGGILVDFAIANSWCLFLLAAQAVSGGVTKSCGTSSSN